MRGADAVAALGAAVSFLTRIPVARRATFDGTAVARGVPLFPLVGAGVCGIAGGVADVVEGPLPPFAAAALAIGLLSLLTGAMHLDAVADTADGLGGWTRERRLEIMRDHAIGSFGAVALAVVLLVEVSLIAELLVDGGAWRSLVVVGACSRAGSLPLAAALPYARADGQGAALAEVAWLPVTAGLVLALAIAIGAAGAAGGAAFVAVLGTTLLLGSFFRSWIGGVTGDTLGATTELGQVAALVALVAAG